jgi:uncharacterized protein
MNTASLIPPFLSTASTAELEDWGPLPEATGEPMHTRGTTIWKDGDQEAGVWECTPGPSRWTIEANEFVYVLYGRMTVIPDGGEPTEIGPEDTVIFAKGWTGTWRSTRRSASSTCSSEARPGPGYTAGGSGPPQNRTATGRA